MTMKAFAVTCEKLYPGKVVYYAAETPEGAISEAQFSIMKIGGKVRRSDIVSMHAPEYDLIAATLERRGCIETQIADLQPIVETTGKP